MSYDPERLWSELEDNAVREFYAKTEEEAVRLFDTRREPIQGRLEV